MYGLYFYICLFASLGMVIGLLILAVVPITLPAVPANHATPPRTTKKPRPRQARSPTPWDPDDDEADL